jgi:O-antigen/teichoic acid export membrane protein
MAKGKMIRDFAMTIGQLFLGLLKFRWGLLPGLVFGQASATGFYVKKIWSDLYGSLSRISVKRMIFVAKRYYRFPIFLMPSQLINELSVHVPVYCLNFFFSNSAVGLYALPQKFLNVPVVLVGNSIGQVFYKDARTHLLSPEEIKKRTFSLFTMLFYISVIPFSIILVFGDVIIGWAFGQGWLQSGVYAQYLSPWLMFVLIGSPISRLFTVLDKQKLSLWLNIILFNLRVAGLAIGTFIFNSAEMAVKLFAITGALYWIFLSFYTLYIAKVRIKPVILNTFIVWLTVLLILFSIRMILPY